MAFVDKVINYITDELNIEITEKNKELIMDKFYPDIKDKIYWSVDIEERRKSFFYEGIITKEQYDLIKTLPPDTNVIFNSDYKDDDDDEGNISEISFIDDVNKVKYIYDKGFEENASYCDLMFYLYENKKFKKTQILL